MAKQLIFNHVRILRMYSTEFHLHLPNLSSHLNIIFGPNGAGKTTIANALNGLLLPGSARKLRLHAEATLNYGHKVLLVDCKNARIECQVNGKTADRSELSQFIRPKSYHLSLQELLPELAGDSDLAVEIIRQANGGFDIPDAGKKLGFERKLRYNKTNESHKFLAATSNLQEILSDQRGLQNQKNQRAHILEELNATKRASERLIHIEKIQKWRSANAEFQNAQAVANAYSPIIQSSYDLTDATEKAQTLYTSIHQLKQDIENQKKTITGIEKSLKNNRLSTNGLEPGVIQRLSADSRDCIEKFRHLESLRETHHAAHEQALSAWKKIGGALQPDWEPEFTREHLIALQKFAKDFGTYSQDKNALHELKRVFETLDHKESDSNTDELRNAQQLLQLWILDLEANSPKLRRLQQLLWIATTLSVLLSIGGGIFLDHTGFLGLIVSSLTLSGLLLLRSNNQGNLSDSQKKHLLAVITELPETPDIASLQSCLTKLLQKRASALFEELKSAELMRIERSLHSLIERESDFEQRRKNLTDSINLPPAENITSLIELVAGVLDWNEMNQKAKELGRRSDIASNQYEELIETLQKSFIQYGYRKPDDHRDAEILLDQLREDDDAVKRDQDGLIKEKEALESILRHLDDQQLEYNKIFTDLELEIGDLSGLANCARQYTDWTIADKKSNESRIRAESLRPHQEIPPEHQSLLDLDDLDEAFSSAKTASNQKQLLQEQLTRLDAEIERTEKGNSLENALADVEAKRVALIHVREQKTAKAIGQVILKQLSEDAIKNAPPVFERANQNFHRVTDGQYSLIIPQNDTFRAKDHHRDRDFDLTELSSATRVQLLLSVRLAFVETHETNYRLPITLDETLANSDDKRAQSIIKTIATLAANRQVFYFTAQQDEVDKWKDVVPEDQLKVYSLT